MAFFVALSLVAFREVIDWWPALTQGSASMRDPQSHLAERDGEEILPGSFILNLPVEDVGRKPDAIADKRWVVRQRRVQIRLPANTWRLTEVSNITQSYDATLFEDSSGGQWTDHIPLRRGPNEIQLRWEKKLAPVNRPPAQRKRETPPMPPASIWIEAL